MEQFSCFEGGALKVKGTGLYVLPYYKTNKTDPNIRSVLTFNLEPSDKAAIPSLQGPCRGEAMPLDEGEHAPREALLQAGLLRNQQPPLPADDAGHQRVQPHVHVLLEDPGA